MPLHRSCRPRVTRSAPRALRWERPLAFLILPVLLWAAAPAAGQQGSLGAIAGMVVTEEGARLAGVSIELIHAAGASSRRQVSDAEGRFLFVSLPTGSYTIRAEHLGYRTEEQDDLDVRSGATVRVTLTLALAPVELEQIDVVLSPVSINRTDPKFTTRLDEAVIELLPARYDPKELIAQTPGARPGHVWGGATAQANNYQLDGLAANHPGVGGDVIEPSISWIESIEVHGLGSGAEYGNFQGGLIDITTKTGTNRWQGALRTSGESAAVNSSNLGGSEIGAETASRYDVEAEMRGALLRDHLFFFAAGHWLERDSRHLNHLRDGARFSAAPTERKEGKFFGKLTWQPTRSDRIDLTAGGLYLRVDHEGQVGYEAPEASWRLTAPTTFYSAGWQHTWGSWAHLEAKVAAFARDEDRAPYRGDSIPGVQVFGITPPNATYRNAPIRLRHAPQGVSSTVQGQVQFNTFGIQHQLKGGAEYSLGSFRDERTRTAGMTWRPPRLPSLDPEDPETWKFSASYFVPSTWGGEVRLHADVENSAVYLQDYITVNERLTLAPGLRYGRWRGWITPDGGRGTRFLAVETDGLDPRIGATLDLTGRNTLVMKGHWGRYHQNLLAQMFDRVEGGNVFTNEQLWYYRGDPLQDPQTTFTAEERDELAEQGLFTLEEEIVLNETGPIENLRQPYVDQWVLGLERTVAGRVKFEAVYVNRRNRQMVALMDRNRRTNYTVYQNVRVYDAARQPLHVNGIPLVLDELHLPNWAILQRMQEIAAGRCDGCRLPPGMTLADGSSLSWAPDYVLTNVPGARRQFDQLQLSIDASFTTWGATGSVVFTRLKGNLDTVTGYDDPSGFGAGPYVRVNEAANSYGALENSADRELKLSVYGQLPWQMRGGAFWQYAVGDHYSPVFTLSGLQYHFATAQRDSIDRAFILPLAGHKVYVGERGRRNYPTWATLDLRLEREFAVGDGMWAVTLDAFNIFNADNVTLHNTSVNRGKNFYPFLPSRIDPNEYYQAVRERLRPRTIRFGTSYRF